ncbi:hypothetical protein BH11PSE10_BH11PSE10_20840 [soil metagenome]
MKSVLLALALASSAAVAASAGDADLLRCLAIAEGPARLACYDGLAIALRDKANQPAPAAAATQNFGLPPSAVAQTAASKVLDSRIEGSVAGWQRDSNIRLVNGQVWQIVGEPASFAPLNSPKVSISPGLFGSYFMEVEGISFQVRVKRVQ